MGSSTAEDLKSLDEDTFLSVFEGVPQFEMKKEDLSSGILDVLAEKTTVFESKGEARRMIQSNAVSINKEKITEDFQLSEDDLLNGKYILSPKRQEKLLFNYCFLIFFKAFASSLCLWLPNIMFVLFFKNTFTPLFPLTL